MHEPLQKLYIPNPSQNEFRHQNAVESQKKVSYLSIKFFLLSENNSKKLANCLLILLAEVGKVMMTKMTSQIAKYVWIYFFVFASFVWHICCFYIGCKCKYCVVVYATDILRCA